MFKFKVFEILAVVWRSRLQGLRVPLQVSGERHQVHRVQVGQLAGKVGTVCRLQLDAHRDDFASPAVERYTACAIARERKSRAA